MRAHRRSIRLVPAIALLAAVLVPGFAGSALATTTVLDGTITADDGVTWSEDAVAVVTLVDMSAKPEAGAILGQERIDNPGAAPIAYEVLYDDARVDPKGAYAAYATIVDGDSVYATALPVPALTGGPDTGVDLAIAAVPDYPASITGSVTPPAGITLSPTAVTTEILVKETTGTPIGVRTIVESTSGPIAYEIGYEPDLIDPNETYVVKAAIVDEGNVWGAPQGVLAIDNGEAVPTVDVAVQPVDGIPVEGASPEPSAPPSAPPSASAPPTPTVEPTEPAPEPTPSPSPSPTPEPSPSPTPTPEASPTPPRRRQARRRRQRRARGDSDHPRRARRPRRARLRPDTHATGNTNASEARRPRRLRRPTPSPTPTPTPTPTPAPTPTPTPTPPPQPVPTAGSVTGSLSFAERAELTSEAQAVVILVEHAGNPITARIIESQPIPDPGQVPIAFELPYTTEEIDPEALYTVSAAIVDGARLWASDDGTRVITYGNPTTVELELVYQSDLLKGQVTGEISGTDVTLAGTGFAAAVVFDETSQVAVGTTVVPAPTGVPIAFSVPFDPAEIDAAAEYVVVAGIIEGESRWANRDGVPVITNDNPVTDVVVPVTAVTPPDEAWGPFGLGWLGWLIVIVIIGAIVAVAIWYWRSRQTPPPDASGPAPYTPITTGAGEPPTPGEPPTQAGEPSTEPPGPGQPPSAG